MTYIKKIYIRDADYDALFKDLVANSYSSGYTELHDFLTKWCNGMQRSYGNSSKGSYNINADPWTSARINSYINNTTTPVVNEKTIIKQARSLGVKVLHNNIDHMNLRSYEEIA